MLLISFFDWRVYHSRVILPCSNESGSQQSVPSQRVETSHFNSLYPWCGFTQII